MSKKKSIHEKIEKDSQSSGDSLAESVERTRSRRKSYVMDLRIHSPASLGYLGIEGIDTAPALVRLAKVKGLDVIAVTDFYSGKYIDRIVDAARESSLTVIPGVVIRCEVESCSDVVLTCLFPENFDSQRIEDFMKALQIPESSFGTEDHIVDVPFDEILSVLESFGGIAIPSRMDKTPHRREGIRTLVEHYGFRTFDLAYPDSKKFFKAQWPKTKFNLYSFSNANALAQVGSRTAKVKMADEGFAGLRSVVERESI